LGVLQILLLTTGTGVITFLWQENLQ